MLDRQTEYLKMAEVEESMWWYRALHALVSNALAVRRNGADGAKRILDAGCGTGGLMMHLRNAGYSDIAGFDLSQDAVAICHKRKLDVVKGDLANVDRLFDENSFDVIISNDTLCYFDNMGCQDVLRKFADILRPDGLLLLNLPALQAFSGIHDIGVGIKQRFDRPSVRSLFESQSLSIEQEMYWPFFVSPLVFVARSIQRMMLKLNPDIEIKSDVEMPSRLVNYLLAKVTLLENNILSNKPFGSSLFVVAKKR